MTIQGNPWKALTDPLKVDMVESDTFRKLRFSTEKKNLLRGAYQRSKADPSLSLYKLLLSQGFTEQDVNEIERAFGKSIRQPQTKI